MTECTIHNDKRHIFSLFISFRKFISPVFQTRKQFILYYEKNISFCKLLHNQKWNKENFKTYNRVLCGNSDRLGALNYCHKETHPHNGKVAGSTSSFQPQHHASKQGRRKMALTRFYAINTVKLTYITIIFHGTKLVHCNSP